MVSVTLSRDWLKMMEQDKVFINHRGNANAVLDGWYRFKAYITDRNETGGYGVFPFEDQYGKIREIGWYVNFHVHSPITKEMDGKCFIGYFTFLQYANDTPEAFLNENFEIKA